MSFADNYELGEPISSHARGYEAVVHFGQRKPSSTDARAPFDEPVAVKVFRRPQAGVRSGEEILQGAYSQANIMKYVGHEHIVHMYDTYFEADNLYVVMELCRGDDLFQWLCDRLQSQGQLLETDARTIAYQMLSALEHCHRRFIVHHDIKLENVLVKWPAQDASKPVHVKLTDFGFSSVMRSGTQVPQTRQKLAISARCQILRPVNSLINVQLDDFRGTTGYKAPEVIAQRGHGVESDMFAFGVCLYLLLGGCPPFSCSECRRRGLGTCKCGRVDRHTRRGYQKGWSFTPVFDRVSPEAKELVKSLLEVQPLLRPTAAQCLSHPWFQKSLSASGSGPMLGGGIASTILSFFPAAAGTGHRGSDDRPLSPPDMEVGQRRRKGSVGGMMERLAKDPKYAAMLSIGAAAEVHVLDEPGVQGCVSLMLSQDSVSANNSLERIHNFLLSPAMCLRLIEGNFMDAVVKCCEIHGIKVYRNLATVCKKLAELPDVAHALYQAPMSVGSAVLDMLFKVASTGSISSRPAARHAIFLLLSHARAVAQRIGQPVEAVVLNLSRQGAFAFVRDVCLTPDRQQGEVVQDALKGLLEAALTRHPDVIFSIIDCGVIPPMLIPMLDRWVPPAFVVVPGGDKNVALRSRLVGIQRTCYILLHEISYVGVGAQYLSSLEASLYPLLKQHMSSATPQRDVASMAVETVRNFTKHGLALPGDIQEALIVCDSQRNFVPVPEAVEDP